MIVDSAGRCMWRFHERACESTQSVQEVMINERRNASSCALSVVRTHCRRELTSPAAELRSLHGLCRYVSVQRGGAASDGNENLLVDYGTSGALRNLRGVKSGSADRSSLKMRAPAIGKSGCHTPLASSSIARTPSTPRSCSE